MGSRVPELPSRGVSWEGTPASSFSRRIAGGTPLLLPRVKEPSYPGWQQDDGISPPQPDGGCGCWLGQPPGWFTALTRVLVLPQDADR